MTGTKTLERRTTRVKRTTKASGARAGASRTRAALKSSKKGTTHRSSKLAHKGQRHESPSAHLHQAAKKRSATSRSTAAKKAAATRSLSARSSAARSLAAKKAAAKRSSLSSYSITTRKAASRRAINAPRNASGRFVAVKKTTKHPAGHSIAAKRATAKKGSTVRSTAKNRWR